MKTKFLGLWVAVLLTILLTACGKRTESETTSVLPSHLGQADVLLPGFDKPQNVTYEIVDGKAMFQGDIILGNVDSEGKLIKSESAIDPQGIATDTGCFVLGLFDCHWRWENGIVPFTINANVTESGRNSIAAAIREWEAKTPIRFVARSQEGDYVEFVKGSQSDACASWVGRGGGRQTIELDSNGNCEIGTLIHEIGHAMGLYHEQSREDRDNHVRIFWDNIEDGQRHNFDRQVNNAFDIGSYDFNSIMHYGSFDFGKKDPETGLRKTTIQTILPGNPIGQRNGLSLGDIASINSIYGITWRELDSTTIASDPAVAYWGPDHLNVFALSSNNTLLHKWYENGGWSPWVDLGGNLSSAPAAVSWGLGRVDVFARGVNGDLLIKSFQNENGWNENDWVSLGGFLAPGSAPAVASWKPGRLDVFFRGADDALYHRAYENGWSDWANLGGRLTSDPAAVSRKPGQIDVFARGTDAALYHKWFDANGWSDWYSLGGTLSSAPTVASWAPEHLDVFATQTLIPGLTSLIHTWFDPESRGWSGWRSYLAILAGGSGPKAVSPSQGRIDVFARSSSNTLLYWGYPQPLPSGSSGNNNPPPEPGDDDPPVCRTKPSLPQCQ
ncbi:MAG: M12 family metallopeptidase [Trueperaceae bacterium]